MLQVGSRDIRLIPVLMVPVCMIRRENCENCRQSKISFEKVSNLNDVIRCHILGNTEVNCIQRWLSRLSLSVLFHIITKGLVQHCSRFFSQFYGRTRQPGKQEGYWGRIFLEGQMVSFKMVYDICICSKLLAGR